MSAWYLYKFFPIVALIGLTVGLFIIYYIWRGGFRDTKLGKNLFKLYYHLRVGDDFLTIEQRSLLSANVILISFLLMIVNPWGVTSLALFLSTVVTWAYIRGQDLKLIRKRKLLLGTAGVLVWLVIYLQYNTIIGHSAGIGAITILITLKLYELDRRRDAMILLFLSQILVMGIFFFSQEIYAAAVAIVIEIVLFASQVAVFDRSGFFWRQQLGNLKSSFKLTIGSLILGAIVFVFFPRPSEPLWSFGLPQSEAKTGLSDTMSPGSIDSLALSSETAFQVEFINKNIPPNNKRYWRGPAFSTYVKGQWRRGTGNSFSGDYSNKLIKEISQKSPERIFIYRMIIEPTYRNWLYGLDTVVRATPKAKYSSTGQLESEKYINTRTAFTLVSIDSLPRTTINNSLSLNDRSTLLRLPNRSGENEPKTRNMAKDWLNKAIKHSNTTNKDISLQGIGTPLSPLSAKQAKQVINLALQHFTVQEFFYTLKPPKLKSKNPTDDFLFNTRQGFCEHYASAFTLLMRAAGIPARVVTGYQGGEINPLTEVMVVRQSDAHAWSEVWIEDEGWMRIDPTFAVAPERIELSLSASLQDNSSLSLLSQNTNLSALRKVLLGWQALQIQWNRWVISYDKESQFKLFANLALPQFSTQELLIIVILIFLGFLIFVYYQNKSKELNQKIENKLWHKVVNKLQSRGVEVDNNMTPKMLYQSVLDFNSAKRATHQKSKQTKKPLIANLDIIREIVRLIETIKYAKISPSSRIKHLKEMQRLVRKI